MAKLVVCKGIRFGGDCIKALEMVKQSTPRGFKKYWENRLSGAYLAAEAIEMKHKKKYAFLLWQGPEDQYLIAKLTENTNMIITQVDIDVYSKEWNEIIYLQKRAYVHYRDKKRTALASKWHDTDREKIYNVYLGILDKVKKDIL